MKTVPPKPRATLWKEYLRWTLGIPLVTLIGCAIIVAALWIGGGGMAARTFDNMGMAILWMGLIVLIYPFMLFLWTAELRQGLRDLREWDQLTPEARAAAIAAHKAARPKRKRRTKAKETEA